MERYWNTCRPNLLLHNRPPPDVSRLTARYDIQIKNDILREQITKIQRHATAYLGRQLLIESKS